MIFPREIWTKLVIIQITLIRTADTLYFYQEKSLYISMLIGSDRNTTTALADAGRSVKSIII